MSGGGLRLSAPTMMIKETSLRRDPDLRGELAFLARGCDFVLPSRFKKRLKSFQQQQVSRCCRQDARGANLDVCAFCTLMRNILYTQKYTQISKCIISFIVSLFYTYVFTDVVLYTHTHTVDSSCCFHTHRVTCQGRQTILRQIAAGY